MLQDARYACRLLARAPAFTISAVLTLALGVGANTAIFSVLRSVLFAPLPFSEPHSLVTIWPAYGVRQPRSAVSVPIYEDMRAATDLFTDAAALTMSTANLTGGAEPERVSVAHTTASFQPLLGLRIERGRWFTAEEDSPGNSSQVVVLAHRFWTARLGGDPGVIGRPLQLNGRAFTVIGILSAAAAFPRDADAWTPIAFTPAQRGPDGRHSEFLDLFARLRPGVSVSAARARLHAMAVPMQRQFYPTTREWTLDARPLPDDLVRSARPILLVVAAAVACVLLIACVNVANLMLARGTHRAREFAVRAALGADPARLRRQLLTETAVLGVLGGACGAIVAAAALPLVGHAAAAAFPQFDAPRLDRAVFAFAFASAFASSIGFGVVPAWRVSRADLRAALGSAARSTISGRMPAALVAVEVALAFALLVSAGLLVRSFGRVIAVDPGFSTPHRLTAGISLPVTRYPRGTTQRAAFYAGLFERLAAIPGVRAAGGVSELPLGPLENMGSFEIKERPTPKGEEEPHADWRSASPEYFRAMGIPLVRGRWFSDRDAAGSPLVAIVDEQAARRLWPDGRALGEHVSIDDPDVWREVVGVVGSVHHDALDEPLRRTIYFPIAQRPTVTSFAVVDGTGDPRALAAGMRAAVRELDPDLPVYDVRTLDDRLSESLDRRRVAMWLVAVFGVLALTLAAVGVYGVIAYDVSQRTHEIGIRTALGADRERVMVWVLARGLRATMAGLGAGLLLALAVTQLGSSLLYGVTPHDPTTYAGLAFVMFGTAVAAGYLPARRATRIDPLVALRE